MFEQHGGAPFGWSTVSKGERRGTRGRGGDGEDGAGSVAAEGALAFGLSETGALGRLMSFWGRETGAACGLCVKASEARRSLPVVSLHHHQAELPSCKEDFVASRACGGDDRTVSVSLSPTLKGPLLSPWAVGSEWGGDSIPPAPGNE